MSVPGTLAVLAALSAVANVPNPIKLTDSFFTNASVIVSNTASTAPFASFLDKAEFIDAVAAKAGLSKKDAKGAVDAVLDTITEALVKKDSVSFIGFGTFSTAGRAAREARVPGTDKTVKVAATTVAKFKVGKALKEAVAK